MPYKRKYRKRRRRKRGLQLLRAPVAPKFFTKLRYYEYITIAIGPGTATGHLFGANCLYDPNITGVGAQPRGWDQLIALYNHAHVLGSKITVEFFNKDPNYPIQAGVRVLTDPTISTSLKDYMEAPNAKHTLLGIRGESSANKRLTEKFSAKKEFSVKNVMDNHDLKNSATANPTEIGYFLVWGCSQDETDDATNIQCSVTIDYITMFSEPNDVGPS